MMKIKIGVVGSASNHSSDELSAKAEQIGREIASQNCITITGAGTGLPNEAAKGARSSGGLSIGISPAINENEHVGKYGFPIENYDLMIYTGFGLKGRNVVFVRSCDCVLAISGRIGTLNELTIAYDEGKPIGILKGTGGISDMVQDIIRIAGKEGAPLVIDSDSSRVIAKIIGVAKERLNMSH